MTNVRSVSSDLPAQRLRLAVGTALTRLLEGPHRWGRFGATTGRSGVSHYRLTIYRPGTSAAERRALTRARDWPALGALAALLIMMGLGDVLHPIPTTVIAVVIWTTGVAVTQYGVRRLRRSVRTLEAVEVFDGQQRVTRGELTLLLALAHALVGLDENLRDGRIDELQYELQWARLYSRAQVTAAVR